MNMQVGYVIIYLVNLPPVLLQRDFMLTFCSMHLLDHNLGDFAVESW